MNIVIDARIVNSSTGTYVERLLHYLQIIDSVNNYTILIPSKDKDYWKPTAANFSVKFADFPNYSLAEQVGFNRMLQQLNPDLVHFCMPQQPILYKGKKVTTFHDLTLLKVYNTDKNWLMFKIKQQIGRHVFKSAVKNSTYIISPTEYTKKDLVDTFKTDSDKIIVTYESAEIKQNGVEEYPVPFKKFLYNVGRHSEYKNIKRLAAAHQKLLTKYPDLGLVLANYPGKDADANKEYFKSKDYKNILFTDRLKLSQRDWLYQNCEALVFPSLYEGFGLPGLEAMANHAPLISSTATCLPEVYGDGAIYFDPLNVNDMADKIDQVLSNNELRTNLIERGQAQYSKYSWEKMARETHAVYMKALDK